MVCTNMGLFPRGRNCFGMAECILLPDPPATIMAYLLVIKKVPHMVRHFKYTF